jgi:hypothetical protein
MSDSSTGSYLHHLTATSGAPRGYENLRALYYINEERQWVAAAATDTRRAVHGPATYSLSAIHTLAALRNVRRAAIPSGVAAILRPGPRSVGVILHVVAFWVPSNIGSITQEDDITNYFPVQQFTMGSTIEAPSEGYRVPMPMELDLPAWSAQGTAHPVLKVVVVHHAVTGGAHTTSGHYLSVEFVGRVDLYGGF